jgi:hypothetical protein
VRRRTGLLSLVLAVLAAVSASLVTRFDPLPGSVADTPFRLLAAKALSVLAVVLAARALPRHAENGS